MGPYGGGYSGGYGGYGGAWDDGRPPTVDERGESSESLVWSTLSKLKRTFFSQGGQGYPSCEGGCWVGRSFLDLSGCVLLSCCVNRVDNPVN